MPETAVIESAETPATTPTPTDETQDVVEETSAYEVMLLQNFGY